MPLFKLKRRGDTDWDEYDGFVIRANTKEEARELAYQEAREGIWLEPSKAFCEVLPVEGEPEVIIGDFHAG